MAVAQKNEVSDMFDTDASRKLTIGCVVQWIPEGDISNQPVAAFVTKIDHVSTYDEPVLGLSLLRPGAVRLEPKASIRHFKDPYCPSHPQVLLRDGVWRHTEEA